jgi:hypothetical protein
MVIGVRRRREGAAGWWAGAQPSGWRAGRSAQWNAGRPSDYAGRGGDRQPDRSSCWWVGGSLLRWSPASARTDTVPPSSPLTSMVGSGNRRPPGQGAAVARCRRVSGVSVATSSIRSPGWNATACLLANGGRLRPGGLEGGGSRYSQSTQRMVVCSRWCGRRLWPRRSSRRSPPAPTRRGVTRRRCDPGSRTRCRPRLTAAHKCRGSGVGWDLGHVCLRSPCGLMGAVFQQGCWPWTRNPPWPQAASRYSSHWSHQAMGRWRSIAIVGRGAGRR